MFGQNRVFKGQKLHLKKFGQFFSYSNKIFSRHLPVKFSNSFAHFYVCPRIKWDVEQLLIRNIFPRLFLRSKYIRNKRQCNHFLHLTHALMSLPQQGDMSNLKQIQEQKKPWSVLGFEPTIFWLTSWVMVFLTPRFFGLHCCLIFLATSRRWP